MCTVKNCMERVVLKQATETPKTLKYGLGIKLLKMSKAKNGFPRVKASKTAIQNQLIYLLTLDSGLSDNCTFFVKKLENFGGHLLSEDDHSYWAPPYWNITKETFSFGRTEL